MELSLITEGKRVYLSRKRGEKRPIPTLASSLNRVCGKDLGFFHTRVPAEVPAKYYPGSF